MKAWVRFASRIPFWSILLVAQLVITFRCSLLPTPSARARPQLRNASLANAEESPSQEDTSRRLRSKIADLERELAEKNVQLDNAQQALRTARKGAAESEGLRSDEQKKSVNRPTELASSLTSGQNAGRGRGGGKQANSSWGFLTAEMIERGDTEGVLAPNSFERGSCARKSAWADAVAGGRDIVLGPAYQRRREVWVLSVLHYAVAKECPFRCLFFADSTGRGRPLATAKAECQGRFRMYKPLDHRPYAIVCEKQIGGYVAVAELRREVSRRLGDVTAIQQAQPEAIPKEMAVCVKPTYKFARSAQLDTFLAWYRHAGASRVFLYNQSWVREVDLLIDRYNDKYPGYVVATAWKFSGGEGQPLGTDGECWPHLGDLETTQYLSHNHCLMQAYVRGHTFTASIDIDEIFWNWRPEEELQAAWLRRYLESMLRSHPHMCSHMVRNIYADTCDHLRETQHLRHTQVRGPPKQIWVTNRVESPDTHHGLCKGEVEASTKELAMFHMRHPPKSTNRIEEPAFLSLMQRFCNVGTLLSEPAGAAGVHEPLALR